MELKKQALTSASHSDFTLEALKQIVPSAFTEVRGADGKPECKLDFDTLRELLGDAILDPDEERFGFYWVGKQEAKRAAAEPTRNTLRPVESESVDWNTTENLYIEGDNLEVLKLLQRAYLGKVKMIYIDPPYNTGNDFVYQDNFTMSSEDMDTAMGNLDEEGNRLRKNPDSNPRYHSEWCNMIYSRLLVARTLLSNDGVIFISIDDNEVHHLRKICDEVFGASNFINCFMWLHGKGKKDTWSRTLQQYTLAYAKNKSILPKWQDKVLTDYTFTNPDDDPKGAWFSGSISFSEERSNPLHRNYYSIESPSKIIWTRQWQVEFDEMNDLIQEGDIFWGYPPKYDHIPRKKIRPQEIEVIPQNIWDDCGTTQSAEKELSQILGGKFFDYPKPMKLLKKIIKIASDTDSLILDFFSGSATTAHAVMQLNAEDGGKRKYICVQLPEETPEDSPARKAGYKTICDIGKERIRRAGKKIKKESPLTTQDLDTGFRVLRVDSSNMEEVYFSPSATTQDNLFSQVDSVKTDRTDLDLLFGCMVDWGVELSHPLHKEEVAGKTLYIVNDGALVACFDKEINLETIRHIASMQPHRVLFRESCFATDADKLNIYEQFKQLCGWNDAESYKRIHVL